MEQEVAVDLSTSNSNRKFKLKSKDFLGSRPRQTNWQTSWKTILIRLRSL